MVVVAHNFEIHRNEDNFVSLCRLAEITFRFAASLMLACFSFVCFALNFRFSFALVLFDCTSNRLSVIPPGSICSTPRVQFEKNEVEIWIRAVHVFGCGRCGKRKE